MYGIFDSLISIFLRLQGVTCRRCFEQGCVQVSDVNRFQALINRLQVKKKHSSACAIIPIYYLGMMFIA